ncbi:XRE family transcriptional regulator [Lactococcus paracarnosus]|uniref:Helix-turn-helix transcriptional regulator n=1 Tax=Pseudolactococcus paracarnosus TaxID=2749962 RepID=A0ABT0AIP4_9LACT|nr:XRE family transcriptional regulator [Lactococcus paracarnosus]MCJ1976411.1 helix-turn-helix transcriptional regulator [Lactococcus paracarnosus]MCJ1982997.1 helix-turn-helix transcriptional regulator [Lactococcus paracarnosus]MCJ1997500.1 helix-turn-helix transcriptional regulator [Lactococcus paracarnosus]
MTLSENLKRIRETQNLSQRQLAKRLGVANTSYFAWEQGTSKPKQANLDKLAQVLHVTLDVLLKDQSSDLLHAFNQLTDDRKENVLVYTENQLVAQKQDNSEKVRQLFPYKVHEKLSAGTGFSYMDDGSYDTVYFDAEISYDFASWVYGDSMEPVFADGSVALIKDVSFDYDGAIYAIDWDGQTYIKKVYKEAGGLRLVSINDNYQDKFAPFDESPRIVGKIIGNFYPIDV